MSECPCKDCAKRVATVEYNCHSHCKDYADWKAELERLKEYNNQDDICADYFNKKMIKRRKEKNEKNRT